MAKILVIDDSRVIRDLLTDFLTDLGHVIELAVDGSQGVAMALQNEYDVIICDVHMPRKNGTRVHDEIREAGLKTPMLMTDSLPGDVSEQPKKKRFEYLLSKPFDLTELKTILDKLIAQAIPR